MLRPRPVPATKVRQELEQVLARHLRARADLRGLLADRAGRARITPQQECPGVHHNSAKLSVEQTRQQRTSPVSWTLNLSTTRRCSQQRVSSLSVKPTRTQTWERTGEAGSGGGSSSKTSSTTGWSRSRYYGRARDSSWARSELAFRCRRRHCHRKTQFAARAR
jgi:hypothetical protein